MRSSLVLLHSRRRLRPLVRLVNDFHSVHHRSYNISSVGAWRVASDPLLGRHRRRPLLTTTTASFHSTTALWEETKTDEESAAVATATNTDEEEPPHPTSIQYSFTPPPPLSEASKLKVKNIFEKFIWLDVIEVHLLDQLVQEKMGLKPSEGGGDGPSLASGGGGSAAAASGEEDIPVEKQLKDVKLIGFDAKAKIKVIKEVRAIGGLGLKEAKELVESAPKVVQKGLKLDKAEELKAQLEAVGAQVEIV